MHKYKKEACRNFQRGSCQYGERCKFLHVTQQQPKSNVFGSGMQTGSHQQQKPNPFGFGVQNASQSKGAADFGSKPNQFKPFENKWTRSSPIPGGAPSSRQPDNQSQAANHKCTDPESCKRQIAEDFEHERPLWGLTCYGHWKNVPCDIVGDISYEELRAAAYDDAKRGLSLQSIVERERSLLNSKLIEFENLLRNPYVIPPNSSLASQRLLSGASPNASFLMAQNTGPPSVSSFSQLGTSPSMGLETRAPALSNNAFGQFNNFPNASQSSTASGTNNLPFGGGGSFGSQLPAQTVGSSFSSNIGFSNSGVMSAQSNSSLTSAVPAQFPSSTSNQSPILPNGSYSTSNVGQITTSVQLVNSKQRENFSGDASIWLKEKWRPGEIPEEAPPDAFV